MKKQIYFLVSLFALIGFSINVMGQGEYTNPAKTVINSTRIYTVNAGDATHTGNGYAWAVYKNTGNTDFNDQAWAGTATAATDVTLSGETTNQATVVWLKGGYYVVQVTETGQGTGCKTIRRFGVHVFDLDLLVKTFDKDGTTEFTANQAAVCNTNSGGIWTADDANDLNAATGVTPALGTMVYTYKVSLYTAKKSTTAADLIGDAIPSAKWRFTPTDNSTLPTTPAQTITWAVTAGGTGSMGSIITVPAGTSEVTLTGTIKNIAADEAQLYKLNFSIAPSTVQIEDSGNSDYAEGTEPSDYDGVTDTGSHYNKAYEVIVNPIPNTSKISSN